MALIDDNFASEALQNSKVNTTNFTNSALYKAIRHSANLYDTSEINLYNRDYRFGLYNPGGTVSKLKEFLFFTKPDLNIINRDANGTVGLKLTPELQNYPFFVDLIDKHRDTIAMLQSSYKYEKGVSDPFNHLLQNTVISNLEVPALEGTVIDSPVNNYGVGFQYRGSSEASDDGIDFSLEFKDTKWLDVYYFFRAYEEYQILKHHGVISPWVDYILNRQLSDQFAVYKFMVDEDMETIVYYCKLYGVMPMNLPRDVFSTEDFTNGISYTINFKAAFFEDMNYMIIRDFNKLYDKVDNSVKKYTLGTYNDVFDTPDTRPARCAIVEAVEDTTLRPGKEGNTRKKYKLVWKGSDMS